MLIHSMSEPQTKAIFLSYAREDAEAARRLADALRAFGIEVWFDMSELRGGDAWDQKIRRQIRDCALFMPVISDKSEEREEGYFRLEWKLAVERTHLLAEGVPFLFPVVVDDTRESDSGVPEAFLKAQWTRLPGGEPTPQFIENVKRQLQAPRRSAGRPRPAAAPEPATRPAGGFPLWAAALLGVAVLVLAAYVVFRPGARPEPAPLAPTPAVPAKAVEPAGPPVAEKSLAVLPFSNMSEEKDSAFFTDGIQEDILTNLALISELHVVSRTSVMQYRDTTKTIRQIAKELGVAYVLEGSVRRAGDKVRVTGQLIRAATDEHVWARAYDRNLTDIFAIQEELATEIAGALKAAITPQQKTIIAGRATGNPEAYNSYLKARQVVLWSDVTRATLPELDRLLQAAVQLDPNFVPAWVEIARVDFASYISSSNGGDVQRLTAGQSALARAVQLAPEDPAVIRAQGKGAEAVDDLTGARAFYERALERAPGDVEILVSLGHLADEERLWAEAMGFHRRAQALDPRNPIVLWDSFAALLNLRQYDQAMGDARLLLDLQPDSFAAKGALAILPFFDHGSRVEMESLFASISPERQRDPVVLAAKFNWYYHSIGDAKAYVDLQDQQGTDLNFSDDDSKLQYAEALIVEGQRERAVALVRPLLERLQARSAADPENEILRNSLSYAQALAGERDAAKANLGLLLSRVKPGDSQRRQVYIRANAAIVYAWIGEKDRTVELMRPLMLIPAAATSSVLAMKNDIDFFPMRGFPAWEALLDDPKNRQPFNY